VLYLYVDDDDFSPTASKELEDMVRGCILHCEVTAVEEDGVPYVMLTKVHGTEVIVCYYCKKLNSLKHLVRTNVAESHN